MATGRRDKTGSRTFAGLPNTIRRDTSFQLSTFMTEWTNQTAAPTQGPLFQAALGATPLLYTGGTVASVTSQTELQFTGPHGLTPGQAMTSGGDIRFVAAVANTRQYSSTLRSRSRRRRERRSAPTMTYTLAEDLPSVSIFDYWDPSTAVAANSERRGDGQDADQGERRFPGVRLFAGRRRICWIARASPAARGADGVSRRAGADGIRLHDRAGAPGTSMDGSVAERILYA